VYTRYRKAGMSGAAVRTAIWALAMPALISTAGCVAHPKGPCGTACPTIESATHILEYPSQRLSILSNVAARPDLSPHEQIYLVNAVFMGGYSWQQANVLVTLVSNPCCTDQTGEHIRKMLKLSRLTGREERRVIEAMERRAAATTQPQAR